MIDSPKAVFQPLADLDIEDFPGYAGRRRKAALTLSLLWGSTVALHLLSWGSWVILGLMAVLSTHALRVMLARPRLGPTPLPSQAGGDNLAVAPRPRLDDWPYVSLLVAATNEEAVIQRPL